MEWSKTKTIMIIALIVTNIIIGYFYWQELTQSEVRSNSEQVKILETIFANNKIDILNLKSPENEQLPKIKLTRLKMKDTDFNVEGYKTTIDGNHTILLTRQLLSVDSERESKVDLGNVSTIEEQVLSWLTKTFRFVEDYHLVNTLRTNDGYLLNFAQLYNGYFIEGSFMSVQIVDAQIVRFQRRWYEVEEMDSQSLELCPYPMALYRLLDAVLEQKSNSETLTFESVSVGYKLESNVFETTIESGEGSPYFRFKAENGEVFFVEALWAQ